MKLFQHKFNRFLRPGPPPPSEEDKRIVDSNPRFEKRPGRFHRRFAEIRPRVSPTILAAYEHAADSTCQQILEFLNAERPELARLFEEELQGSRRRGPKDLRGALGRIGYRKASEELNGRHTMSRLAAAGKLVVALPVPPHLEDWTFEQVDEAMVFLAEDPPPHLEKLNLSFLDDLLPKEIHETLANVTGILAEGQIRSGAISTRRTVVRLIQMLPSTQVTVFLHNMPHRPPHAEFAQVDKAVEVVEMS